MKANGKILMKIANLAITMILAIPMFLLAVPIYMYNKIRGKV
jgi:hypothetical protein